MRSQTFGILTVLQLNMDLCRQTELAGTRQSSNPRRIATCISY